LTPEELYKKFALPKIPTKLAKVKVPIDEQFREGLVNHRSGQWDDRIDVMQYQFMGDLKQLEKKGAFGDPESL